MWSVVTTRHGEVDPGLRERAESILERLAEFARRAVEGAVVFDTDGGEQTAELKLHLPGGRVLIATGAAPDHRSALDRAEDKIRRQIDRSTTAARRGRRPPTSQAQ
ncbi:MAG: HPF/RaiA family ribosome-associated protein [Gemmatimonadetes bacterium]|nr:HPF/RaiA family ribosome-associated protein [Gemmatimonadota bacterium]